MGRGSDSLRRLHYKLLILRDRFENGQVAEWSNAPDCKKLQRPVERQDGKVGEFRETLGVKDVEGNPEPSPTEKVGKVQRLKRPPPKAKTCLQQEAMVMR